MRYINRLSSIIRYLSWSAPIYKWKLSRSDCPNCGKSFFLSLQNNPFMTRCLRCSANITNLSLIPVIKKHFHNTYSNKIAYELSSYGSTLIWLNKNFSQVFFSEFFPGHKLGGVVNGIMNQDVQQLTYKDDSFDLITSNQVFEHVPDDVKGYSECYRILRSGGAFIISIPIKEIERTKQKAYVESDGIVFIGEPEFHDSRLDGAKSVPVFWHHSRKDICNRIKSVGFSRVDIVEVMISENQCSPSPVIYAIK